MQQHLLRIGRMCTIVLIGTGVVIITLWLIVREPALPWERSGRLVLVTRALPGTDERHILTFGVDDAFAVTTDSDRQRLTLRSRQVTLDPNRSGEFHVLLDAAVPTGTYAALSFRLKNPGLQGGPSSDTLPNIVLLAEQLLFDTPFSVAKDAVTVLVLGFEIAPALRSGPDDTLTYLPVVTVEARTGASVSIDTDGGVIVDGGTIEGIRTFGMDRDGRLRFNYREPPAPLPDTQTTPEPVAPTSRDNGATTTTEATDTDPMIEGEQEENP